MRTAKSMKRAWRTVAAAGTLSSLFAGIAVSQAAAPGANDYSLAGLGAASPRESAPRRSPPTSSSTGQSELAAATPTEGG